MRLSRTICDKVILYMASSIIIAVIVSIVPASYYFAEKTEKPHEKNAVKAETSIGRDDIFGDKQATADLPLLRSDHKPVGMIFAGRNQLLMMIGAMGFLAFGVFYYAKAYITAKQEIDHRKQIETVLRESVTQLTELVDFFPDAMFAVDSAGKITMWNRAMEKMTGVKAQDMLGKGDYEYSLPLYGERRPQLIDLVFKSDEELEQKYHYVKKEGDLLLAEADVPVQGGELRTLWVLARPLFDSQGNLVGAIESFRDITDRKKIEDELFHSRQMFQIVLDAIPQRVFWKDRNSVYLGSNKCASQDFGFPNPRDLIGTTDYDSATTKEIAELYRADDRFVMATGQARINYEEPQRREDGNIYWVRTSKMPLYSKDGQIIGVVGTYEDITERKILSEELFHSQQMLQLVLDAIPQRVFWKDRNSVWLGSNKSFAQDMGYAAPSDLIGKTDYDAAATLELAEQYRADDENVMETGQARINYEEPQRREDGNIYWIRTSKMPLYSKDGQVIGVVGTYEDITDRKDAEAKIKRYTTELERSNRDLEQFAYVSSHDLQEPLRKIIAFGDLLKTTCAANLDDKGLDYLERMQNAAIRMRQVIEDLLAFSRITTKANPDVPVDLITVVHDVLSNLDYRITEVGGRVETGSLPTVLADQLQMFQLFQNLVANALKFQKEGVSPQVIIRSSSTKTGATEISVEDNGIGFDEKYLDRMFMPFQRLHTRNEYEGTGIGLAICYKIVERHGWTISAKSEPGKGATFLITIPPLS